MRLIDADALAKELMHEGLGYQYNRVINAPTVDAVPVIRCKDCRHNLDGSCEWHYGTGYRWNVDDDDYCSCAERKDEYVTLHHEDINFINDDAERAFYEALTKMKNTRSFTAEKWEFYKKVNREKMQKTGLNIYDLMNKKEEE